jgi:hypothetical protein
MNLCRRRLAEQVAESNRLESIAPLVSALLAAF